jgi:hypothetical protein
MTVEAEVSLEFRRTLKKPKLDVLDALWISFCQERRKVTQTSGSIIKEKALILIRKMSGSNEFTASEVWLNRWKKRHGIHQMVISGERLSADHIAAKDFIKTTEILINDNCFVPDQIYSIDETGLNYKMLPQKKTSLQIKKSQ